MGSFLGQHLPEYNPFWEEKDYDDKPDWWKWYHLGYDDGYASHEFPVSEYQRLQKENEQLRDLLSANVRVMKAEIKKEMGL